MAGALEGDIFIGPKAEVRKPVYCTSPRVSVCSCKEGLEQLCLKELCSLVSAYRSEELNRLSLLRVSRVEWEAS